ncbi:MAG: hypothetical protein ABFS32_13540 [Bacteroidota bacterium]
MKRVLMLMAFTIVLWSCGSNQVEPEPELTETNVDFTVTGAKSTSSTTDYPAEITYITLGGFSSLKVSIGNIGQTDDAFTFTVAELENSDGIEPGTYNYTTDENANIILTALYADNDNFWLIYEQAIDLPNQVTINTISNSMIKGEFEFNFQNDNSTDLIKVAGTFEGPSAL